MEDAPGIAREVAGAPFRADGEAGTARTVVAQADSEAIAPTLPLPAMALSPRGDRRFYHHAVPGGTVQIRVRHWDRLSSEALPRAPVEAGLCAFWSPTGHLPVVRSNGVLWEILALRPDIDPAPRPLVATPAEERSPAVSPDGRWLAYFSDASGRREVYVSPFPDAGAARVQVSGGGGMTPLWSRDGRELFFVDGQRRMAVAAVLPSCRARRSARPRRALFPLAGYRINPWQAPFEAAPDGRFLMGRQRRPTELRLVVVTRFLDELARRDATRRDAARR